jgi:peptidoglycan/LPS O-acetylase OafA/YrhL
VFLVVLYGNDGFGLLRTPGARFLGTISYNLYLIHPIVLYAGFHLANHFFPVTSLSAPHLWLLALACGMALVCISAVTYRFVEHPWLLRAAPVGGAVPTTDGDRRQS